MRFIWIIIGRILFAAVFVISGFNHFSPGLIGYASSAGVPAANVLVPIAGILAIVGGLSIALCAFTRIGALLLVAYLIPVTLKMHAFWSVTDAMQRANELNHFLLNVALLGGALAFFYFGSGPISVDDRLAATHRSWRRAIDLHA